jgi:poly(3-hydroxyalkanoate) synthetase
MTLIKTSASRRDVMPPLSISILNGLNTGQVQVTLQISGHIQKYTNV